MRLPSQWYPLHEAIVSRFPFLTPAQQANVALFVGGTVLADSGCESALVAALVQLTADGEHPPTANALRERLRDFLRDGAAKAAPCRTELTISDCVAPLVRWVLELLPDQDVALALDATTHGEVTALVVSLLYRGHAIPVAWAMRGTAEKGAWMPILVQLVEQVLAAFPTSRRVVGMADEGLWSPRLFRCMCAAGCVPLIRLHQTTMVTPLGGQPIVAERLAPTPGTAWVGRATVFQGRATRQYATVIVVWVPGTEEPWVLITTGAPAAVGPLWYRMRFWIESGFRDLKSMGWSWDRTRRVDCTRVERHWLILALATLYALAYGTRLEEQERQGLSMGELPSFPLLPPRQPRRPPTLSLFTRGKLELRKRLYRGALWAVLWLQTAPWPEPPPMLSITLHPAEPP